MLTTWIKKSQLDRYSMHSFICALNYKVICWISWANAAYRSLSWGKVYLWDQSLLNRCEAEQLVCITHGIHSLMHTSVPFNMTDNNWVPAVASNHIRTWSIGGELMLLLWLGPREASKEVKRSEVVCTTGKRWTTPYLLLVCITALRQHELASEGDICKLFSP